MFTVKDLAPSTVLYLRGGSTSGDPSLIYPMEMDPYFLAPIGADPVTFAALQARFTFSGPCAITNVSRLRTRVINGSDQKLSGIDLLAEFTAPEPVGGVDVTVGGSLTYFLEYKLDEARIDIRQMALWRRHDHLLVDPLGIAGSPHLADRGVGRAIADLRQEP